MNLGKVAGNIVSTHKYPGLTGKKLLMVYPINGKLEKTGGPFIAVDNVGAGNGEYVIYITSAEACIPFKSSVQYTPTDATIVGIIDKVNVSEV